MDGTLVIGSIGLVTTLLGPIVQTRLAARDQKKVWRRGLQTTVYTEAMSHAQNLETSIERITDPFATSRVRPELTHVDLITARMRLFAPPSVLDAWDSLRKSEEALWWNIEQEYPGLGHTGEAVPDDHHDVLRVRAAINNFHQVVRKAVED